MPPIARLRRSWRGVTLVELLVVITLLLIVTAVTLPVVAPSIQQRRVREATRLVTSYLAAARARALETGRPVAVVIERFTPGLANATSTASAGVSQNYSMSLSIAESPPLYAGDTLVSAVSISHPPATLPPYPSQLYLSFNTSIDNWNAQQIRVGDGIRFNFQGPIYYFDSSNPYNTNNNIISLTNINTLSQPSYPSNWSAYYSVGLLPNITTYNPSTPGTVVNTAIDTSLVLTPPYNSGYQPGNPNIPPGGSPVPYQIYRQPTRSAVDPLQLPEGIVIDLAYSGMSTESYGIFSQPNATAVPPFTPSNVMIAFSPTGRMTMLYDQVPLRPTGAVFLLLGRIEQCGISTTALPFGNLTDVNSFWIGISNQSGQIIVGENHSNSSTLSPYYLDLNSARGNLTGSTTGTIMTTGGR